jgi:hypothetical protein
VGPFLQPAVHPSFPPLSGSCFLPCASAGPLGLGLVSSVSHQVLLTSPLVPAGRASHGAWCTKLHSTQATWLPAAPWTRGREYFDAYSILRRMLWSEPAQPREFPLDLLFQDLRQKQLSTDKMEGR